MKFVTALVLLLVGTSAIAQVSQTFSLRGPRPAIDLRSVPDTAYEKGQIAIKFKASFTQKIDALPNVQQGTIHFNIPLVDQILKQSLAYQANKLFVQPSMQKIRHEQWGFNRWFTLFLPDTVNIKRVIALLASTNAFDVVEPQYKIATAGFNSTLTYTPNDEKFIDQWALKNTGQANGTIGSDMKVADAWDLEKGKPNVVVAMIDRGIQYDHPDLAQNMWPSLGYNFLTNNNVITPEPHGTGTAGIIGAVSNNSIGISGIAGGDGTANSGIRLMSCQTFAGNTNGGFAEAIIWAADHGAVICSNSWVFTNAGVYRQSVLDAIDYFCNYGGGTVLQGGLCVFAAGNNGEERLTYPACYERVIGVTGTTNKDIRSSFSNYGSWVDLSAPAGDGSGTNADIITTNTAGYVFFSGTSACAPQVAGVAALVASKLAGKASASDVRNILLNTADNIDGLNPSYAGKLGTGRVNALKALQKAQDMLATYTVATPTNFSSSVDCNMIELSWNKNNNNNEVIIAYSATNGIGNPINGTAYNIGSSLPNGGTVIYKGAATNFSLTIPNTNVFQYFKVFSVTATNQYSFGVQLELLTGPVFSINNNTSYDEGIEGLSFPYQALKVFNPDKAITWERTIDAKHSGTISAFIRNFDYTAKTQTDIMYLPKLQVHNADSIVLSFWRAYKAAASADSLAVIASFDCGKTYSTVWKKGGNDLATTTGTQASAYIPIDADWAKEQLVFGIPKNTDKVIIGFEAINGNGQYLYLDDISVKTKTLPAKLKADGVLITPNPFSKQLTIQHYIPPTDLNSISIFTSSAQLVYQQNFKGNADSLISLDLGKLNKGVYLVKLDYKDKRITKKVVKL
jgi:subtilisin family serine protease